MKDFIGQEIKPGDYIMYVTRPGNSPQLNLGKVISADHGNFVPDSHFTTEGREWDEIKAYRVTYEYMWGQNKPSWYEPRLKKVTLQYPDRIIVIKPEQIQDKKTIQYFDDLERLLGEKID